MTKHMMTLIAGIIFGIGLILSGMTNPSKVIGFLDITGNWDPSLAFVMVGAILVGFFGFRKAEQTNTTLFCEPIHLPGKTHISKELIIGSLLFGAGWALAGFCPGPAIVALGAGYQEAITFVIAMLLGMLIHDNLYETLKK
ncbi:MAG: hypothetical protein CTY35_04350 [Methylotenera sp.]|nr:MAG: hypothetical protein CTY35_04350 [Methylotenera sp.]